MTTSDSIALLALVVALVSLVLTAFFNFRDRANLIAKSEFLPHWNDSPAHVRVTIVNSGRRSMILRLWAGADAKGEFVGTFMGTDGRGHRLGEYERHEFKLEKHELLSPTPDLDVEIQDIWFEDTLGSRYTVKGAKENLAKLWAS